MASGAPSTEASKPQTPKGKKASVKTAKQVKVPKAKKAKSQERIELRKKKRAAKAEAKKVRKANSNPATMTEGQLAERDAKRISKKKQRLLARSKRFEMKGNKLLAEAKKAAELYQKLVEAEGNVADPEAESKMDDDSDTTSSSGSDSESATSESESESEDDVPAAKNDDIALPTNVPADEIVLKRRRTSEAASEKSAVREALVDVEGDKKAKKSKKAKSEDETTDKKEKKAEKKRKRAAEVEEAAAVEEPSPKEKKEKKDKKVKKTKEKKATKEDEPTAANAEQWHVDELDGGSARQAKFLRLLGGKKAGGAGSASTEHASKGKSDSVKAEADIQRQFEAGIKMKHEGGNHRRGLGA